MSFFCQPLRVPPRGHWLSLHRLAFEAGGRLGKCRFKRQVRSDLTLLTGRVSLAERRIIPIAGPSTGGERRLQKSAICASLPTRPA